MRDHSGIGDLGEVLNQAANMVQPPLHDNSGSRENSLVVTQRNGGGLRVLGVVHR